MKKGSYKISLDIKYIKKIPRVISQLWNAGFVLETDGIKTNSPSVVGRTCKQVINKISKEIYSTMLHETDFHKWVLVERRKSLCFRCGGHEYNRSGEPISHAKCYET